MKTAIFISEDRQQIVLTPENEWERNILKTLEESKKDFNVYWGQFNDVQGGWTMHEKQGYRGKENDSLLIVLDNEKEKK